jgi:AcrR family transcriptional regulator
VAKNTKNNIIFRAKRLFSKYGYAGTTTRMIASDVGIDVSTIHYHFKTKRILWDYLYSDITERFKNHLREVSETVDTLRINKIDFVIKSLARYLLNNKYDAILLFPYLVKTCEKKTHKKLTEHFSMIKKLLSSAGKRNFCKKTTILFFITLYNFALVNEKSDIINVLEFDFRVKSRLTKKL